MAFRSTSDDYRKHAAEARQRAESMRHEGARRAMLRVAIFYDRLAERAEQQASSGEEAARVESQASTGDDAASELR